MNTEQNNLHYAGFRKEAGLGNIAQQAAKGDIGQQQRFKPFGNSQV